MPPVENPVTKSLSDICINLTLILNIRVHSNDAYIPNKVALPFLFTCINTAQDLATEVHLVTQETRTIHLNSTHNNTSIFYVSLSNIAKAKCLSNQQSNYSPLHRHLWKTECNRRLTCITKFKTFCQNIPKQKNRHHYQWPKQGQKWPDMNTEEQDGQMKSNLKWICSEKASKKGSKKRFRHQKRL